MNERSFILFFLFAFAVSTVSLTQKNLVAANAVSANVIDHGATDPRVIWNKKEWFLFYITVNTRNLKPNKK